MADKYDNIVRKRLGLLLYAKKCGNIEKACRIFDVSRSTYYRLKKRYAKHGVKGLMYLSRAHKSHPQTTAKPVLNLVKQLWQKNPNYSWITYKLNSTGTAIAYKTVRKIVLNYCLI
ncbi:MAG: helix-turn-helix domain-containing protein [Planctomycetes bacterium]|nr:helix-turn-helix domain-containing protein [Planctomycetota bacterium]